MNEVSQDVKQLLLFWSTFSDEIKIHMSSHVTQQIQLISNNLGNLSYNDGLLILKTFMDMNCKKITKLILLSTKKTNDTIQHFKVNLDRWKRIDTSFKISGIYYDFIVMMAKLSKAKNLFVHQNEIEQVCREYCKNQNNKQLLILMKLAIEINSGMMIDIMKEHIDWRCYVKSGVEPNKHVLTKGIKFGAILDIDKLTADV